MKTDAWPFGDLRPLSYNLILADPPWRYEMRSPRGYRKAPEHQYRTMNDDDLKALPVHRLARDHCFLILWAVWPRLPFALEVIDAWGFKYCTGGAWAKRTKTGKIRLGPGYRFRSCCEPFLVGTLGNPPRDSRSCRNFIDGLAREHSRKPDKMRSLCEQLTPSGYRAELFARESWPGNSVWGDETAKFAGVSS
jgi:N6-adenosine-specific RNA methylase IME4